MKKEVKKEIGNISKSISISEYKDTKYREFWNHNNRSKNAFIPFEQLLVVARRFIYAAYKLNLKLNEEVKISEIVGELNKVHPHSQDSIMDSLKGFGTPYRTQVEARLLNGVGNFGSLDGGGGNPRYLFATATPLLRSIYEDIEFCNMGVDEEDVPYLSLPLPLGLINGSSLIGTGKSAYFAERNAKEIIDWIKNMIDEDDWSLPAPQAISTTGCKTYFNHKNGYIYYDAVIHKKVDKYDITKKGKYDVITNLPPTTNSDLVISSLREKIPYFAKNTTRQALIEDGSGKGNPIYIILPTGYLNDENEYYKLNLRKSRIEAEYIWDTKLETLRKSNIQEIAKEWLEVRSDLVKRKLEKRIYDLEFANHKIDIIKIYAENDCMNKNEDEIIKLFTSINKDTGLEDAKILGSMPSRTFYPENVDLNELSRDKNNKEIKINKSKIKNIYKTVIDEAYSIMESQIKFYDSL